MKPDHDEPDALPFPLDRIAEPEPIDDADEVESDQPPTLPFPAPLEPPPPQAA